MEIKSKRLHGTFWCLFNGSNCNWMRQRPTELMQTKCKVNSWSKLINGVTAVEFLGRPVQSMGEFQPWKPRFLSARSAEINKLPKCRSLCASAETVPPCPGLSLSNCWIMQQVERAGPVPGETIRFGGGLEAVLFLSPAVFLLALVAPNWSGLFRQRFNPNV